MSRQCDVCGKTANRAQKVSFSNKHNTYKQYPNLQTVKADLNGKVQKIKICTSCIKSNKVKKAI
ncbi:MAG: 50S ribosomal protein L28, partial [Candidatus Gastranaerophilales bacterium]|nr:50S ribosomal protein L28 [Candidatus Gastranaerophilales bacterium]